ncbi:MAG TPA: HEAT repeat domain-containing protein [Planctomycetota bacterium]|nr:HEAT repeat domain-containing protein [Planctomycetota bacterium]
MPGRPFTVTVLLVVLVVTAAAHAFPAEDISQEVQDLVKKMRHHGDWGVRGRAAEMLGYVGDQAVLSDMAECFNWHPPEFAEKITEALGRLGGERALRVLTTLLRNRYHLQGWNGEQLRLLGEAVGRIDHEKKEVLDLMRNRHEKGCEYSEGKPEPEMLFCMAWYGDDKAVAALVNEMKTADPKRQHLVAERLGEIGNRKADEEMCMLVDYSEDKTLRKVCALSLGRRRARLAVESLLDALAAGLELEASQALGMIGDRQAVAELKPLLLHKSDVVKLNVAFALARLGDKSGVEFAKGQLESQDTLTKTKAAATLLAAGEENGLAKLKEVWTTLDAKERYWFIMDNLKGDAWATDFLKEVAASDKYPGTRQTAAEALEKTKE